MYEFSDDEMKTAIIDSGGNISQIARKLKCAWSTAHKYISESYTFKKMVEQERQNLKTLAIDVIMDAMTNPHGEPRLALDAAKFTVGRLKDDGDFMTDNDAGAQGVTVNIVRDEDDEEPAEA